MSRALVRGRAAWLAGEPASHLTGLARQSHVVIERGTSEEPIADGPTDEIALNAEVAQDE